MSLTGANDSSICNIRSPFVDETSRLPAVMRTPFTFALLPLGAQLVVGLPSLPPPLCISKSQQNPIASQYPTSTTGLLNGTLAVIPIPLSQAQEIVKPVGTILTSAIRELLPDWPADKFPAILHALQDHDVGAAGLNIPDFSVRPFFTQSFIETLHDLTPILSA
jgi:hypothetical protein